jgi:hypothetical protein
MLICKPGQTNPSAERHQRPPPDLHRTHRSLSCEFNDQGS